MKLTKEIGRTIESCIPSDYVSHIIELESGVHVHITHKCGTSYVACYIPTDDQKSLVIHSLSVCPKNRRYGIGKRLMDIGEAIGRALGLQRLCLFADRDKWMKLWYERLGYEFLEDFKSEDPYHDNDIWMEKSLLVE